MYNTFHAPKARRLPVFDKSEMHLALFQDLNVPDLGKRCV
jgi:hypothetical protein